MVSVNRGQCFSFRPEVESEGRQVYDINLLLNNRRCARTSFGASVKFKIKDVFFLVKLFGFFFNDLFTVLL